jgi:hypothetical protein
MEKYLDIQKMRSQIKSIAPCLLFALVVGFPKLLKAQSSNGGGGGRGTWGQRAQARESSRWTLQEWLAQKQRNNLMDQWLMMNSPSPFEFSIGGASNSYQLQKDQLAMVNHSSTSLAASAFAQAVGLTGEYENNLSEKLSDLSGMLSLRVLGSSLQTTSITLHAGQRTRSYLEGTERESVRNLFTQLSLQAYMTKYFGIFGAYRQYYPTDHSSLGSVSGHHIEGGLFIDFGGLRIFGNWSDELQENKATSGTKTQYKRQGLKSGLVIFF